MSSLKDKLIDEAWPFAGGCAFCGDADKRHRVFDMIVDRHVGGDSVEVLTKDYCVKASVIRAVLVKFGGIKT